MAKGKVKVYTASSVGIDYFFFLGRTIGSAGFDVVPLYLIPEADYRSRARSSGFGKVWLRLQMYIFYPVYLVAKVLTCNKDSIFVISSNTFYAPYLVHLFLSFRGMKVVHMLYDLFPDALEVTGSLKTNGRVARVIGRLTALSQRNCAATVYLGDFLKNHAERRWGKAKCSATIDISTDLSLYSDSLALPGDDGPLIVHYGGQLGHLHDAVSIIESVKYIHESDISDSVRFNFYVSGAQANFLEDSLKGYPVDIKSAVPSHQWREDIKAFHIGLVSLSPGGASICLPSKTYGMMGGGMAILAICPVWSDLAKLVTDLDAGWVVNNSPFNLEGELNTSLYADNLTAKRNPKDVAKDVYRQLKELSGRRQEINAKRKNAFFNVRAEYGIDSLSGKWNDLINRLQ